MSALEILALPPLVFWLLLALDRSRAWPRDHFLPPGAERPAPGSRVVAVVPARDEAAVLPDTLPTLLAQQVPAGCRFSVILVDDGSTDGTARVAREIAAEAGRGERLRVVPATPRPAGWAGKVHALACGVAAATEAPDGGPGEGGEGGRAPDWLLFTDADVRHRPGSLAGLLAQAGRGFDFVSVMARLHTRTFWEKLLIPPFVFFFQLLYPFRRVADPRSRVAAAAGGCILVRRRSLEAAGGVAAIRDAVIDDVSLARRVAAAGGRLWLGLDPGIASVRPYRGLGELWAMVARSAFTQLRYRWELLVLALVGLLVFVVAPPVVAAVAAVVLGTGGTGDGAAVALAAALVAWALEAALLWPAVRHHRVAGGWAFGLPLAGLLYALMTFTSAWDHWRGRGVRWKGRAYRGDGPDKKNQGSE